MHNRLNTTYRSVPTLGRKKGYSRRRRLEAARYKGTSRALTMGVMANTDADLTPGNVLTKTGKPEQEW